MTLLQQALDTFKCLNYSIRGPKKAHNRQFFLKRLNNNKHFEELEAVSLDNIGEIKWQFKQK